MKALIFLIGIWIAGRIIFSDFMIQSSKAQRMLELMIGSLVLRREGY